ncbi:MAG: hypothetical protein Q7S43_04425 [bacterium]|nr:hypothetical protein [bacterium]
MNKINVDKKPVIGFDMDGVIVDNADAKIRIAKIHGFELKPHHTPSEIIRTILPQVILGKLQKTLYDNPRFVMSTPLMRGVKSILVNLTSRRIPIFLISRRKIPEVAIKILKKNSLWPKYFNKNNSFFVLHPEDKNTRAAQLGITHYIDDETKVLNVLSSVPNKFLFDQFNVFDKADQYTKIKSWAEFKKLIKSS